MSGGLIIKQISAFIPNSAGIYQMLNANGKIIYIGKAKDLKKRVYSYSSFNLSPKTAFMVSLVHNVKWIITNSEKEALILEADLIKNIKPQFNILLKDDKSQPFIKFWLEDQYPRITKYRGKNKTQSKDLLGPFASSKEADEFIKILQKLFLLRTCSNATFNNRVSPCILHQIKRCSAPCVNKISTQDYATLCKQAINFLKGNSQLLKETLSNQMQQAKEKQDFESAIIFRDRLIQLNNTLSKQSILLNNSENADFIAIVPAVQYNKESYFIKLFMLRGGHNYGFVDKMLEFKVETSIEEALEYFLMQYYQNMADIPNIYTNVSITATHIAEVLQDKSQKAIKILTPNNTQKKDLMQIVINNAHESLQKYFADNTKWLEKFNSLKDFFKLPNSINNIEIYDNSHFFGELPLGVMVSANISGFNKNNYRIFNVKDNINPSDDYAILNEVFTRRFAKDTKLEKPDLILVDGGKGQFNIAKNVLQQHNINIPLVAIAKGEERNKSQEKLFLDNQLISNNQIPINILHFIQQLRNEAHRFAVKSINQRKQKSLKTSGLDGIPAIGKKRKQLLLNQFGSIQNIKQASVEQLEKTPMFNKALATSVYNYFNSKTKS